MTNGLLNTLYSLFILFPLMLVTITGYLYLFIRYLKKHNQINIEYNRLRLNLNNDDEASKFKEIVSYKWKIRAKTLTILLQYAVFFGCVYYLNKDDIVGKMEYLLHNYDYDSQELKYLWFIKGLIIYLDRYLYENIKLHLDVDIFRCTTIVALQYIVLTLSIILAYIQSLCSNIVSNKN